jgi:hypothetical protein
MWLGGRGAVFTPSSNFTDFGNEDILSFGRVESGGMPEDFVVIKVRIGV